jgi:putative membrane protein
MVAGVALAAASAFGCAKSKPAQTVQTTGATVPQLPVPSMVLTSGEILGIVQDQTKAHLEESKLAVHKASDPQVKRFAEEAVTDLTAREDRQHRLMKGLGIVKPTETMIGVHIKEVEAQRMSQLKELSGNTFDHAFMDGQIDTLKSVLQTYDKDLIPNAKEPQMKESLETWRARAERRLTEAERIRGSLAPK